MTIRQRFDAPLQIKSVSETGEFSGYGSVFGVTDSYGDIIVSGAFADSLADWKSKGRMPAMLWQHNMSEPIGVWTKMEEDEKGLYVEGRLLIDGDPLSKRAHAHMKAGSLSGLSIGYSLVQGAYRYDSDKDALLLEKINLWEVSPVTFPANDEARIEQVKHALAVGKLPSVREVERCLRDVGFSAQQAKAVMAEGYKGISTRDAGDALEQANELLKTIIGATTP